MTDRPGSNEEQYFARREAELLEKRRREAEAQRSAEAARALRELHHMRCPKCGRELVEERYHGVAVDRCADCKGVWFDAGEVESLLDREPGALAGLFGDLLRGLGGGKPRT